MVGKPAVVDINSVLRAHVLFVGRGDLRNPAQKSNGLVYVTTDMYFKSKKISLLILGVTSAVCSRAMFFFFNDPEGPNLLVVTGMAAIIYFLSLAVYVFYPSTLPFTGLKRLLVTVFIQIVIATGFYFCLS